MTTPRARAMRTATALFIARTSPGELWNVLVDALERAELLELAIAQASIRQAEERAHTVLLVDAARALRREGVNPRTWAAMVRALHTYAGQRDLPLAVAES